jgi:hypothetical protein
MLFYKFISYLVSTDAKVTLTLCACARAYVCVCVCGQFLSNFRVIVMCFHMIIIIC